MRVGRGAVSPARPTSPRTPRREGKAWGGGCAGAAEALPPACAAEVKTEAYPLPALHPNVPDVAACGGGGLFGVVRWRGVGCRRKRSALAGGRAGVRTRPPPHAFPSLPPLLPTDWGMCAERTPPYPHATFSPMILAYSYHRSS